MPSKSPIATAHALYGPAFEHKSKKDVAESMAEWAEMTEEERGYVAAHLTYLNVVAQAHTQRQLGRIANLLDELVDAAAGLAGGDEEEPGPGADQVIDARYDQGGSPVEADELLREDEAVVDGDAAEMAGGAP